LSSSGSHCLMVVWEKPGRMKVILHRSHFIEVLTFGAEICTWMSRDLTQLVVGGLCSWKLWITSRSECGTKNSFKLCCEVQTANRKAN
jgi:hypothetical protein